jgi:hypothetical protein
MLYGLKDYKIYFCIHQTTPLFDFRARSYDYFTGKCTCMPSRGYAGLKRRFLKSSTNEAFTCRTFHAFILN